jgi:hypothetical protein
MSGEAVVVGDRILDVGVSRCANRAGDPRAMEALRSRLLYTCQVVERFELDLLADDPFEVDAQAAHLFKHPHLGLADVYDTWTSDPLFYPAKPPAHWLMVAEVARRVLVVPLAPSRDDDPTRCRPIGCYEASPGLANTYRRDRDEY